MIKTLNNEVEIYKAEKKVLKIKSRSERKGISTGENSINIQLEMAEEELRKQLLFEEYNVVGSRNSYFPYKFNDKNKLILIDLNDNKSEVFSYSDVEKVEIAPHYTEEVITHTTTKKKRGITRAIVGGALFGGAGAIIGAGTAGSKSRGTTTQRMKFNGYNFVVSLTNGTNYTFIPSTSSPKEPTEDMLELEYYFKTRVIGKYGNNDQDIDILKYENDSKLHSSHIYDENQLYLDPQKEKRIKRKLRKEHIIKYWFLYYLFVVFLIFLILIALIWLV